MSPDLPSQPVQPDELPLPKPFMPFKAAPSYICEETITHEIDSFLRPFHEGYSPVLLGTFGVFGCSPLQPQARALVYDFGPGVVTSPVADRMAPLPTLVLGEVESPAALDSTAVLYRLGYSDAQQPRPYAQACWRRPNWCASACASSWANAAPCCKRSKAWGWQSLA